MLVKDIMTEAPACCTPDTPLDAVARLMVDHHCGLIPVARDEHSRHLIGVVTDRDIVCRALAPGCNPLELTASECMSKPAVAIRPEATVEECCKALERHLVRRLPVVDEHGNCLGIVAQADIARAAARQWIAEVVRAVSEPTAEPARVP